MLKFRQSARTGVKSLLYSSGKLSLSNDCPDVNVRFLTRSCPEGQISGNVTQECPAIQKSDKIQGSDPLCHVDRATWDKAKPFEDMPGPKPIPIFGNTWRFLPKIGEYYKLEVNQFLETVQKQYGNVIRLRGIIGQPEAVYLLSPEDIETVYKQESVNPARNILPSMTYFRENMRQEVFKDAKGLLTSNGDDWYQFRNKVNTIMMQPKMVRQYIEPVDVISLEFVEKIKRNRNSENRVEDCIMNMTNKWALEIIASLALDTRLGCLADDLPLDSIPYKIVQNSQSVLAIGEKLDFQPNLWKYISTPTYRKAMRLYNEQINLAQTNINSALERIKQKKESGVQIGSNKEVSVLEKLLDIDPKVAVVMVSDMMLAGIDTTSTAFINILYHLAKNSIKQEKLREEILSILPSKSQPIKADNLNQMPYLRACIKEAARIYPVTPGTMRDLTKDTVMSGYRIPKGTKIFFVHMFLSVKEEQFARPLEFIPERWLRENVDSELYYKNAHPFSAMHFGFGSRSCIGRRFAELELEVAVVNFIRHFNMSWDGPNPVKGTTSINYLRAPFNFIFKDNNLSQN